MDSSNLYETWQRVCTQVKSYDSVNPAQVDAFFGQLQPQAASEGFLIVTAGTEFIKSQVEKRFMTVIQQALKDLFGIDYIVEIEVDANTVPAGTAPTATPVSTMAAPGGSAAMVPGTGGETQTTSAPMPLSRADQGNAPIQTQAAATGPIPPVAHNGGGDFGTQQPQTFATPVFHQNPNSYEAMAADFAAAARNAMGNTPPYQGHETLQSFEADVTPAHTSEPEPPARLNGAASALTFDSFVIGESNRLAYSMAVAVAEAPGKPNLNPLFIYGKSGLGKTHLLRAIQNYIIETNPTMRVVYIDSSEFLSDYTSAVAEHNVNKNSYQNFQNRYLNADVLLIDDVQYFQGKSATVDIVFQLFNKLTNQGKQVVLAADRAPKMIDIDERYTSRFNSGGTFPIEPPEVETKLGIIKSFIEEYKRSEDKWDFYIPEDIQMYIAEVSSSNVRELKSAVTKVISQITYFNNPNITLSDAKTLLENHFSAGMMKRLNVGTIQKEVEQFYKVSHADLIGPKRSRNIMYARQVAIYLCRQMLDIPYNDIGKKFGGKDHSTIMYTVDKIEGLMKESRELQEEMEVIIKNIREN